MTLRRFLKLCKIAKLALLQPQFFFTLIKFRKHTMVPAISYFYNLTVALRVRTKKGAIVECGTWKGGMIAGIAEILGSERSYYLFDSYEGLPLATELDGKSAVDWQQNTASDLFYDNCSASEDDAREAMFMAKVYEPNIIKGWFENTLPGADIAKGIALLRMDGDWYDSTMHILKNLFHKVVPGGIIIIDDYYTWDGCSKAVHDYLSEEKRCERIRSFNGVCYIEKLDN